jgi:DNA-binding LacI/PurR family transcriptional regulator
LLLRQRPVAVVARQVDGFILATALGEDPVVRAAAATSTPVVLVNGTSDDLLEPSVAPGDYAGIRMAVAHLVAWATGAAVGGVKLGAEPVEQPVRSAGEVERAQHLGCIASPGWLVQQQPSGVAPAQCGSDEHVAPSDGVT